MRINYAGIFHFWLIFHWAVILRRKLWVRGEYWSAFRDEKNSYKNPDLRFLFYTKEIYCCHGSQFVVKPPTLRSLHFMRNHEQKLYIMPPPLHVSQRCFQSNVVIFSFSNAATVAACEQRVLCTLCVCIFTSSSLEINHCHVLAVV